MAAADREAALSLIDPRFLESPLVDPWGRAPTLGQQFDWYDAVGWQWALENCEMGNGDAVECTVTARNAWSDAMDLEPITGVYLVGFGNDGIVAVEDESRAFRSQWLPMVYSVFEEWVRTNHPEDAQVMFNFGVDLNPEMLAMYELNSERFTDAQQNR